MEGIKTMIDELKQLINKVIKLSDYADEQKYHPSTINGLITIELKLKKILEGIKNNEN
tara:strand:+ start:2266 stop:2439 length:174 start_codon:yes stop_codon:yes gene_type:complete